MKMVSKMIYTTFYFKQNNKKIKLQLSKNCEIKLRKQTEDYSVK